MSSSTRRHALTTGVAAFLAATQMLPARAQSWPAHSLRMIVPFPPGGGTDSVARLLADGLAQRLGQAVVIDNRPGASSVIGVEAVVKAAPDGYTLLFSGASTFAILPALRENLNYDVTRDLAPIAVVTNVPLVVVCSAASRPYRTLAEVIARARAEPGSVTYSTFGPGSQPHLAAELLADAAGIQMRAVPYKGGPDSLVGVMRGDVDIGIEAVASLGPLVKSGKLRALAVTGAERSVFLPDVPGMAELNLSGAHIQGFYALAAPVGTPAPVIERLVREVDAIMRTPEAKARCEELSLEPVVGNPEGLRTEIASELVRYRTLNQRLKIRLD